MTPDEVAQVCHEANKAYCLVTGDRSQLAWEDAPDWQKNSVKRGVLALIVDPSLSPEELHAHWMRQKISEGWIYGLIKDVDKKMHPCIVDYRDLPEIQRLKDQLFQAIVRVLADLPKGYSQI